MLATYGALVDGLRPLGLAYLSVLHKEPAGELVQELRRRFDGPLIANSGFGSPTTRDEAVRLIDDAHAEAVAVGRLVIANPDLVERWAGRAPGERAEPGDLLRRRAPRATPTTRRSPSADGRRLARPVARGHLRRDRDGPNFRRYAEPTRPPYRPRTGRAAARGRARVPTGG